MGKTKYSPYAPMPVCITCQKCGHVSVSRRKYRKHFKECRGVDASLHEETKLYLGSGNMIINHGEVLPLTCGRLEFKTPLPEILEPNLNRKATILCASKTTKRSRVE